MEEKVKEEVKEQKGLRDYLVLALIIMAVVALGLVVVNQTLAYIYKSQLLQGPCILCAELNPSQSKCISQCFTYSITPSWTNHNNEIKEINLSNFIVTSP